MPTYEIFLPRKVRFKRSIFMLAILLTFAFAEVASACGGTEIEGARFPLRVEPGKRYLSDAQGRPYFIQGDAAWSLIAELDRVDSETYLQDRKKRGFNTILVNLIEHRFATNAPANFYGDRPFLKEGDFTLPNEHYFRHADWVIKRACELGFTVLLAPLYAGAGGGGEGWYREAKRAGPKKLETYGRFLGKRYRDLDNIIWVQGGDHNPPDKALYRAIAKGISETDGTALQTAHTSPGSAAMDYWPVEPWLSINTVYNYGAVLESSREQYLRSGNLPFLLIESYYENEHEVNSVQLRQQAYQAVLSGAAGHVFGNNPIWHFSGPGIFPVDSTWQQALDSPGSRSMSILHDLITSSQWWKLIPDLDDSFLVSGHGVSDERAAAALARDGSFALVYVPTHRTMRIDTSRLSNGLVVGQWIDPTNGHSLDIKNTVYEPGEHMLSTPTSNSLGYGDWILEMRPVGSESKSQ
jgi:hypothetical protein